MTTQEVYENLLRDAVSIYSKEGLKEKLESGRRLKIKLGADPSRPDLHLGHSVVLRKLRMLQDLGHEIVFVIGDFTAMIGDPSGRSKTRVPLTFEQTRENSRSYYEQVTKILDKDKTRITYNSEWLSKMNFADVLTLGLHPNIGDARTVTLDLPAAEAELLDAQEQLGVEGWEGVTVIDYDGIIPYAAEFTDLPMELEEFNAFTKAVRDIPRFEVPKLKALLEQFEVQDIETALFLTEHLADYILTPNLSSPQEAALDQLCFIMNREEAVRLIPYVNLFNYGETVIHADNAALTSYGLLHRADYQPMLSSVQKASEVNMTMR